MIRNPAIDPKEALAIKRRIDSSNQERTDVVEYIDSYFLDKYKDVVPQQGASINTESPAWAIDRLSILALKIFHMDIEANRLDASEEHKISCGQKLNTLLEQRGDLCRAIDELIRDIEHVFHRFWKGGIRTGSGKGNGNGLPDSLDKLIYRDLDKFCHR